MEYIKTSPGLASVVLCHMNLTVNLSVVVENLLNGLFLLTLTVPPLSHRLYFHFLNSFLCRGGSSFDKCKTHHQLVSSPPQTALCFEYRFPPPPAPCPKPSGGISCYVPYILPDAHSYGNKDSLFRFFFLYTPTLGSGRPGLHHMSILVSRWGVLAARLARGNAESSSIRWHENQILFNVASLFRANSVLSDSLSI